MKNKNLRISLTVGTFIAVLYIIDIILSLFITIPSQKMLHIQLMELSLPGFSWLDFPNFLWGLLLSFLYGFLGTRLFLLIYKIFFKKEKGAK